MLKSLKRRLANWCLRKLFNAVTEDSFLQIKFGKVRDSKGRTLSEGVIIVGNKELPLQETRAYAAEARALLALNIYKKVFESMKWTANEMIYQKSKNADDLLASKMALYTLDVLEKKFENIAKL